MGVSRITPEVRVALDAMSGMWSSSTWETRARLWERFPGILHRESYKTDTPSRSDVRATSASVNTNQGVIVHVLKFSRGAAIYLPAGPSGHIIFSNYDVVFSNCMEGGVYSFVIFLLGCYFVTFKVLCPPTEPPAIWPRVPVGGEPR